MNRNLMIVAAGFVFATIMVFVLSADKGGKRQSAVGPKDGASVDGGHRVAEDEQ